MTPFYLMCFLPTRANKSHSRKGEKISEELRETANYGVIIIRASVGTPG